jgi:hypothetical protein
MTQERLRLQKSQWKKWGPYLSDRQWGTVREDYSASGDAWNYITHDMARSKAYRWGEEGIGGISDAEQLLCFALTFWNKKDPILKERYFGLTNTEGNHGEDVKELYYYLDNTPTHSYMKMLYKYPQRPYPYAQLVEENRRRSREELEYELVDTGIFDDDQYFDIQIEYAKASPHELLIQITVLNRGSEEAALNVLPTLWFRNTWAWGCDTYCPQLSSVTNKNLAAYHRELGTYYLLSEEEADLLFCDNETNTRHLYGHEAGTGYYKDGINDHLIHGACTVNPFHTGTKAAFNYDLILSAGEQRVIRLALLPNLSNKFEHFDKIFYKRKKEADAFYGEVLKEDHDSEIIKIKRQALAGLLWSKQFYYYDVHQWLNGDPAGPPPAPQRLRARNAEWKHLHTKEVLSVPDKWEFPWFASWDMAFHCITLAMVDMEEAKGQLMYLTKEYYMHPSGELPAYEWNFSDSNPPVYSMATWEIYKAEKTAKGGKGDILFLEQMFHKLMLNFTWWVNRKDKQGSNIFEGGFLGLDNIGVIDRNAPMLGGGTLEQADATSWMAMYSLNMLRISQELSSCNPAYPEISAKFFDHFLYIAGAMNEGAKNLWYEEDHFYYDRLLLPEGETLCLKVRSMVGLIPLFVVQTMLETEIRHSKAFHERMKWFQQNRPDLAKLVSHWSEVNKDGRHLFGLLRGFRLKEILGRLLDEQEFLSEYGVRSLSKYYDQHPYHFHCAVGDFTVKYTPGESDNTMFGGNSNWRGPVWLPMNWLVIISLRRFYSFYGDDFKVECPTGSGKYLTLNEVADELSRRLFTIFKLNKDGLRPVFGGDQKLQRDEHFKDYFLFYEYFHGDTGKGLGASHQTGWTALIAGLSYPPLNKESERQKAVPEAAQAGSV